MVTDAGTLEQLVIARARIRELETALRRWYETLPEPADPHDSHTRGHYHSICAGCSDELALIKLIERRFIPPPALPAAAVTP